MCISAHTNFLNFNFVSEGNTPLLVSFKDFNKNIKNLYTQSVKILIVTDVGYT